MAAEFVYNLKPKEVQEGHYNISTDIHRHGNYILDVAGLEVGSYVLSFLPITADLEAKTARVVVRALVVETIDTSATEIKIAKNPYIEDGMTLNTGKNGAVVQSVDRTNADHNKVTLAAAFGTKVDTGDTLFEASAAGGTTPEAVANSTLCENRKVTEGINSVVPLIRAFEIGPEKLVMPFCATDRANLPHFQFNEQKGRTRLQH